MDSKEPSVLAPIMAVALENTLKSLAHWGHIAGQGVAALRVADPGGCESGRLDGILALLTRGETLGKDIMAFFDHLPRPGAPPPS